MESKLCVSRAGGKGEGGMKARKRKKGKEYTRSAGLVKFRGTVGPYKVGEKV